MNEFIVVNTIEDLDTISQELIKKAEDALSLSYAPYSNFQVAAAVLLENQIVITGTNQENAAYPSGMCAERVALYSVASQIKKFQILKIAVVARIYGSVELAPASSCGPCRQVMLEFEMRQERPIEVIMQSQEKQWVKALTVKSLLPFCFTSKNLQPPQKKQ